MVNNKISYQDPMEGCRAFLDRYSDYRDGRLDDLGRSRFIGHMAECGPCRRYDRVVRRGVDVLRKAPQGVPRRRLSVGDVRRLATAFERESLALGTAGSGVTLAAATLVALLLAAVAWSPFLSRHTPDVRMPPVVAGAPPVPVAPSVSLSETRASEFRQSDLGDIFRSMLFELGPGSSQESEADPEPE